MPMNPNFLCCIGAELKNSTQQTTRMSQVYLYRSFEDETLSDMLSAGFFNAAMGIIRQDDLLLLYSPNETTAKYAYARVSSVSSSGVVIQQIGIDATGISVDTTGYSNLSGNNLQEILNNLDATLTTINNAFVKKDGSSIMTGPLKFRDGSFVGAITGGLGDGISIYKLKSDNTIDSEVASLTKENGFTPGTTNAQDIGSSSLKWKDLYVARVIAAVLNNGADINVPTVSGTMALVEDINNKITNCITEIPQDIKLGLADGTLTLKAGSKVYIPNGSGVFDIITISSDKTLTNTTDGTYVVCVTGGAGLVQRDISRCVSGATRSLTTTYMLWYDTTNNVINNYGSDSSTPAQTVSLPIAIITVSNGAISSIDQVFNGFGYIGSTVFALPGVKGLVPNGRNADGTLRNNERTVSSVLTYNSTYWYNNVELYIGANSIYVSRSVTYDETNNTLSATNVFCAGKANLTSDFTVKSLTPKFPFRAVDYNDTDFIAHQAMPSDRYVDLTLGATATTYTAPADGYVTLRMNATAINQYIRIRGSAIGAVSVAPTSSTDLICSKPVQKGETFQVTYTTNGNLTYFRFIYANGAK